MKYKFTFLFLVGVLLIGTQAKAQQPAQYSLFMLNKYNYNTAYAGLDGSLSATGVVRKQWVSFPGSPLTFQFNAHTPIPYIRSGVGLGFEYDAIGAERMLKMRLSYNYIINLGKAQLSLGASGNFLQRTLDGDILRTPDGQYSGGINHNDPILGNISSRGNTWTAEVGVYYKHPKFEIGVSAINLQEPIAKLSAANIVQEIKYKRNLFLQAQYNWDIASRWTIAPTLLAKTDLVKTQIDLAASVWYDNRFLGGVGYRGFTANAQDAVFLYVGMQITKNLLLAYNYDISLNALRSFNSGSHEIVLNYNLQKEMGKQIPQKIIYNPRFL